MTVIGESLLSLIGQNRLTLTKALDEKLTNVSGLSYDGVKVQKSKENVMEDRIIKVAELREQALEMLYIHCTDDWQTVKKMDALPLHDVCSCMEYYFYQGLTLDRTADTMGVCYRTVVRWMGIGLLEFAKLYCPDYQQ